nr:MAG TPA: hypothetical protein [Caudoviricetes sp.]
MSSSESNESNLYLVVLGIPYLFINLSINLSAFSSRE